MLIFFLCRLSVPCVLSVKKMTIRNHDIITIPTAAKRLSLLWLLIITTTIGFSQPPRTILSLNEGWRSVANDTNQQAYTGFEQVGFNDKAWKPVTVPHNWDTYEGVRRMKHGNRHGYAWYRKTFTLTSQQPQHRYFLYFEGVGSYATVYLNGKQVGYHAGGRTTFTIDITKAIVFGKPNLLAVRADHPAFIKDLPWVCGGCSDEIGFSEGSQPMGIFRPVSLVITNEVRIEPFGVHAWNDTTVTEKAATVFVETAWKNYGNTQRNITITNRLLDQQGKVVAEASLLNATAATPTNQRLTITGNVHLWSIDDPYLYTLVTQIKEENKLIDEVSTPYGIRWISWPIGRAGGSKQFFLNGKPVLINGTAEYEHILGQSHAFSDEQVKAIVMQTQAAGFNAFRDAHQPHNLRFQQYWDQLGILWWPQFAAHIWYDTPAFRDNFKQLLRDWVKERRNDPSNILWGLENESVLPADFAKECSAIIRSLDPTASSQRKITTCNGGNGTDWDVPQNWTGTYGGNPATYAADLQKQLLVGEYGAWRSIDLHTTGNATTGTLTSEDKMAQLLETKIRLAEQAKDSVCGHFNWLLYSHENPGRAQSGEGYREIDRIGPVNYKGLFTLWGEPTDAFYLYQSNYAPADKAPMVYIVSHTWPDRWTEPGIKDSISIYSNCDEVELFNDVNAVSLGRKQKGTKGTHFLWNQVSIQYNVLYAVGYVKGKAVAKDYILLHHLPLAPHLHSFMQDTADVLKPAPGMHYLYRVNCGGPACTDSYGNTWNADTHKTGKDGWGSLSWADHYTGIPAYFASERSDNEPVSNTHAWWFFQSYRYGREALQYQFPIANGDYTVELYFTEPWYGVGGGSDCTGWRLFDVAVNDQTVVHNLDIWKEAGYGKAIKKTIAVHVTDGQIRITFPSVKAGQAIISAIAIASRNTPTTIIAKASPGLITELQLAKQDPNWGLSAQDSNWMINSWLNTGDVVYSSPRFALVTKPVRFSALPAALYGAEWLQMPRAIHPAGDTVASFRVSKRAVIYIGLDHSLAPPAWMKEYSATNTRINLNGADYTNRFDVYRKEVAAGEKVILGSFRGAIPPYLVAVTEAASIDPAYDLKQAVSYKIANAIMHGPGITADSVNGKKCISFRNATGDTLVWHITPGVADVYTLSLRYVNETTRLLQVKMKLVGPGGVLMKEETLTFNPYLKGKWGILQTTTGTSINAGNYEIVLVAKDAAGLSIGNLEIQ